MPDDDAPRLSPLVMMSLACVLLSMGACAIASVLIMVATPMWGVVIVGLPLVGALGAVLAVLGIKQVERSEGRFVGRALAIVSLFCGIVSALLQGAAVGSAAAQVMAVKRNLAPVVETFVLAAARKDRAAQRATLGDGASKALSDERMDWFLGQLERRMGAPQGAEFGFGVMVRASQTVRSAAAAIAVPGGPAQTVTENPKPMELVFARGGLIAFVTPDDDAMRAQQRIAIADMLVLLPDGAGLALREDGPATSLAARVGVRVVTRE